MIDDQRLYRSVKWERSLCLNVPRPWHAELAEHTQWPYSCIQTTQDLKNDLSQTIYGHNYPITHIIHSLYHETWIKFGVQKQKNHDLLSEEKVSKTKRNQLVLGVCNFCLFFTLHFIHSLYKETWLQKQIPVPLSICFFSIFSARPLPASCLQQYTNLLNNALNKIIWMFVLNFFVNRPMYWLVNY